MKYLSRDLVELTQNDPEYITVNQHLSDPQED